MLLLSPSTDEDRANKLDFWAELFKSNTWEELRSLADISPIGKEVAEVMYEATIQSEEKTIFEAHQRYLDCMTAVSTQSSVLLKFYHTYEMIFPLNI